MTLEREKEIREAVEAARETNSMDYGAYLNANDAVDLLVEVDLLRSLLRECDTQLLRDNWELRAKIEGKLK